MAAPYIVHMIAGALAIVIGFVALLSGKGVPLHRRAGMAFVYPMLVLAVTGVGIAVWKGDPGSIIGGSLATYLVCTGLITVKPLTTGWKRALVGAACVGAAVALFSIIRAAQSLDRTGAAAGYLMFAAAASLAVRGDFRILRLGAPTGAPRLRRHLWRMCMALWIATSSFFLGPRRRVEKILPDALVTTPLLVIPVVTILLVMVYWLWRLRSRVPERGVVIR